MERYRLRTLQRLFADYQFENGRINQRDKKETKEAIRKELYRRLEQTIRFLDCAENEYEVNRIYDQFINH